MLLGQGSRPHARFNEWLPFVQAGTKDPFAEITVYKDTWTDNLLIAFITSRIANVIGAHHHSLCPRDSYISTMNISFVSSVQTSCPFCVQHTFCLFLLLSFFDDMELHAVYNVGRLCNFVSVTKWQ